MIMTSPSQRGQPCVCTTRSQSDARTTIRRRQLRPPTIAGETAGAASTAEVAATSSAAVTPIVWTPRVSTRRRRRQRFPGCHRGGGCGVDLPQRRRRTACHRRRRSRGLRTGLLAASAAVAAPSCAAARDDCIDAPPPPPPATTTRFTEVRRRRLRTSDAPPPPPAKLPAAVCRAAIKAASRTADRRHLRPEPPTRTFRIVTRDDGQTSPCTLPPGPPRTTRGAEPLLRTARGHHQRLSRPPAP